MDPQQLALIQLLSGNPNMGSYGGSQAPQLPTAPQIPQGQLSMPASPFAQATSQAQQQQSNQTGNIFGNLFGMLPGMQQPQQPNLNGPWPSPYSPDWAAYERATLGPIKMMG